MNNMLRCRRGSAAFATVVALVPLIGVVALGAEAGSWYVIKQHAQNAADSAAMSGALALANSDSQANFGTLNGFSPNVTVTQGTYSPGSGFSAGGAPVNAVQAVVTQCQPQNLSLVVYQGSCNGTANNVAIKAQAVASVQSPKKLPCALALSGPITFNDAAVQVTAPNCGIASNGTPIGINFKVAPHQAPVVGSFSTAGSCSGSYCNSVSPPVQTYAPPVIDPFSALISAMTTPSPLKLTNACSGLLPYTASNPCANSFSGSQKSNANIITQNGVYFFSDLTLNGGGSLVTATNITATIILLPGAGLTMTGNSSLNITAPTTQPPSTSLPSQLQSVAKYLKDMAIFDTETSPKIGGTSTMSGSGVFYLPNANPLNYQGNPTSSSTCTEVIAASISFTGTPNFDNSGCPSSIVPTSHLVVLVQ
jgi:Flp pilus assembly protein TadG